MLPGTLPRLPVTSSRVINIDGAGPVLFEKSRRAKRVVISVRPSQGARVAVPVNTSFKKALEFACLKKDWIKKHLAGMRQVESRRRPFPPVVDKAEARDKLTGRLVQLALQHGFTYNRVTIRNQKTRWGSCSCRNNISLNMKLVLLPAELIDYVILHELLHTRIHNHGKEFWHELGTYIPNCKSLAKQLRMDDPGLPS